MHIQNLMAYSMRKKSKLSCEAENPIIAAVESAKYKEKADSKKILLTIRLFSLLGLNLAPDSLDTSHT